MSNNKLLLFWYYAAFVQMRIVPDNVDVRFSKNGMSGLHSIALDGLKTRSLYSLFGSGVARNAGDY